MVRVHLISLNFFRVILVLTIPFFIVLYGASGHKFRYDPETVLYFLIITGALITVTVYHRVKIGISTIYWVVKLIAITFSLLTFIGGINAAWIELNFKYGSDISIIFIFFIRVVLFLFLLANLIVVVNLILPKSETSNNNL